MNAADVLAYLQECPEFLLEHARTLGIRPAGGKVQTFAEARRLAQEHKTAKMTEQFAEMAQAADANFKTTARLLACAKCLLAADGADAVCQAFSGSLTRDFALPAHMLCLLDTAVSAKPSDTVCTIGAGHAARAALSAAALPVCADRLPARLMDLLPASGKGLESFLCLPVVSSDGGNIAVLLAGDADAERFKNGMPTDLVTELAALFAAALERCKGKP